MSLLTPFFCILLCETSFLLAVADINAVGMGYDNSGRLLKRCLSVEPRFVPTGSSTVEMTSNQGFKNLQDSLTGSIEVGADVLMGLLSGSGRLDFCKEASSQDLEHTEDFSYKITLGQFAIFDSELTEEGRQLMTKGQCGDQFVRSVTLGGSFYLVTKLRFKSVESYRRFTKRVTVEALWGLISKTFTSVDETRDGTREIDLEIKAFQSGGDPSKLNKLLMSPLALACRAYQNPAVCFEVHRTLFDYAKYELPKQFEIPSDPDQLKPFLNTLEILDASLAKYRL